MKKIIKYYADLEILGYISFGIQMFIYMTIAYIKGIESIKINMIAQVFIVSVIVGSLNKLIFESNIIKEKMKVYISYFTNLGVLSFCIYKLSWTKELQISEVSGFVIYTISYISIYIIYGMYLNFIGEQYTNSLKIYQSRKRR